MAALLLQYLTISISVMCIFAKDVISMYVCMQNGSILAVLVIISNDKQLNNGHTLLGMYMCFPYFNICIESYGHKLSHT